MAEMTPADVPDEWLVAAHDAYYDDVHPSEHIATWRAMRTMLAAVLPLHAQQLREQIAAELRAAMFDCPTHGAVRPNFDPGCISCQRHAALTGAMNLIEGRESFGAKVVREMRTAASVVEDASEEGQERG